MAAPMARPSAVTALFASLDAPPPRLASARHAMRLLAPLPPAVEVRKKKRKKWNGRRIGAALVLVSEDDAGA